MFWINFITIFRKKLSTKELSDYSLFENKDFAASIISEISKQVPTEIINNLKSIKCFPIFVSSDVNEPKNKDTFIIGDAFFAFGKLNLIVDTPLVPSLSFYSIVAVSVVESPERAVISIVEVLGVVDATVILV